MFKISEFARLGQVSVATLRHYDKLGLLKPIEVDRFTGYRTYSAGQLGQLNRILVFKDLGLSLDQIAQLLQDDLPVDRLRAMLQHKQIELAEQVRAEQSRLARVESRLKQIERENEMANYDVLLKNVAPLTVVGLRAQITVPAEQAPLFDEVYAYLARSGVSPAGAGLAIWHVGETDLDRGEYLEVEAAVPIAAPLADGVRFKVHQLPAAELASVVHQGSWTTMTQAYYALQMWSAANGYRLADPERTIYIQAGADADDEGSITEIQFPLEPELRLDPLKLVLSDDELLIFTERARQVVACAADQARRLNQTRLEPEHLLAGLLEIRRGMAGHVLTGLGVSEDRLAALISSKPAATGQPASGLIVSEAIQQVLAEAMAEYRRLGHDYVGTEHLLLGLTRLPDGYAAQLFGGLGTSPEQVRECRLERHPSQA